MIPGWIADTVRAFGRQLGLRAFALNDRGAAGVRFENGIGLYLEYADGTMYVSTGVPVDASAETQKKLLAAAHPSARAEVRMRAVRHERSGEARFVASLPDRELTTTALEGVFRALWQAADYFRRTVA